jgi:hypothetical protein
MNYFGEGGSSVAPYWMHALQWTLLELLPSFIRRFVITKTYKSLLASARASAAASASAAEGKKSK